MSDDTKSMLALAGMLAFYTAIFVLFSLVR